MEEADRRLHVEAVGEEDGESLALEAPPGERLHPVQSRLHLGCHVAPVHRGRPDDQVGVDVGRVDILHVVLDDAAVFRGRLAREASLAWPDVHVVQVKMPYLVLSPLIQPVQEVEC